MSVNYTEGIAASNYVCAFGAKNFEMAAQQIAKRLVLRRMLDYAKGREDGPAHVKEWLTDLFEDPMREVKILPGPLDNSYPEEGRAIQYTRGAFLHVFQDLFKSHSTHGLSVNDVLRSERIPNHSVQGRAFFTIDLRASTDEIVRNLVAILPEARRRYDIEEKSIPILRAPDELLRTIERILAHWDWRVLRENDFPVGPKKALAEGLYPSVDSDPLNALKKLVRSREHEVMSDQFAADLCWRHYFGEGQ